MGGTEVLWVEQVFVHLLWPVCPAHKHTGWRWTVCYGRPLWKQNWINGLQLWGCSRPQRYLSKFNIGRGTVDDMRGLMMFIYSVIYLNY